jgi:hypothetical protein
LTLVKSFELDIITELNETGKGSGSGRMINHNSLSNEKIKKITTFRLNEFAGKS